MIYNQDISLDLNTNTSYLVVGAKQGDNIGRTLTATILENGEIFNISSDVSASYRIRKPTGKAVWKTAEVYSHPVNKVKITFDTNDLDTSGRNYADILLRQNATRMATVSFIIDVQAAPNIVEGATESEAFNYLYDMVDEAGNIIESAQAWATGKRGSDEVIGDLYTIAAPSQLNVSLDFDIFKENIEPTTINKVTNYTFIYMNGNWEYNGGLVDMSELGFTITGTPEQNYIITVTASFADPTFENNAKYYKNRAEATVYGTIDGEVVDIDDPAYQNNAVWLGEAWATGYVDGQRIPTTDPAYEKNANWYGQTWATGSFDGTPVSSSDPTYKNNSKYYRDVIAASTVDEVTTANPGMPAQASAEFDTVDDRFEFDFVVPSIKPHATIHVNNVPYTQKAAASVQINDAPERAAQGEAQNLQKSFDFSFDIPRGIYTGISDDATAIVEETLDPGENASVSISTREAEVEDDQPNEKIFDFVFKIPRGNTGATGAYLTDIQVVQNSLGEAKLQYKLSTDGASSSWREASGIIPVINGENGEAGLTGNPGRGIAGVSINNNYQLVITYSDGTSETIQTPIRGPQGNSGIGSIGTAGRGIAGVSINNNDQLVITYTDNTSEIIPTSIRGPRGEDGNDGNDGNDGQNATVIQIGNISEAAAGSGPDVIATTDPNTGITRLDFVLPTSAPGVTIDDTTTSNATVWSSNKVNAELIPIKTNISSLQTNVTTLKTEVENANTGLLSRTSILETKTSALETNSTSHGNSIANINSKIGNTAMTGTLTSNINDIHNQLDNVTNGVVKRLDNHDNDITVLQTQMTTKQQALSFSYNPNDEGDLIIAFVT